MQGFKGQRQERVAAKVLSQTFLGRLQRKRRNGKRKGKQGSERRKKLTEKWRKSEC